MLANLSKGEITIQDINSMETLMLNALSYHLCPPTCHSFIGSFYACMPSAMKERVGLHLVHQTVFMSEISVMKVCFKDISASHIAFGAMLHVMDSLDATIVSPCERAAFVQDISENCFLLISASSCSARTTTVSQAKKDLTASRLREARFWSGVNRARYQFERIVADCHSACCFNGNCVIMKYSSCDDDDTDDENTTSTPAGVGDNREDYGNADECRDDENTVISAFGALPGTIVYERE
jgi:hypothetical protein